MTDINARQIALKAFTDQDLIDELVERRFDWLADDQGHYDESDADNELLPLD